MNYRKIRVGYDSDDYKFLRFFKHERGAEGLVCLLGYIFGSFVYKVC